MTSTVIDQIRALEEQRSALITDAKDQALEVIHTQIDTLRELGFEYELSAKSGKRTKPATRTRKPTGHPQGECPICGFETDPPHDARHHRGQEPKRPFTDLELAERGFTKLIKEPAEVQSPTTESSTSEAVDTHDQAEVA